ncbi:putative protoporphyrinogen oxidase [Nostocoides japonicum T1-X7]|uniref:Putative protoporphyrinogen oxidase n=1 Tax=Nostocoides japonicum T1-X7 TaxID=1194083 RepID=A0A077LYG6_9MICO|nr:putative protoporphyrinogen oxidase [Tetrasphaera japonica T1-X7]
MPDTVDRVGARVVVVGGGMAGLAAAYDLSAEPGLDVVLLDASDAVGGKLRQATVAGLPVDVGAESVLAVRPELVDLVTQVGLADLLTTPSTTSSFVWSRGALHPLPSGTVMGIPGDPDAAAGILDDAEVARLAGERPYAVPAGARDVAVGEYVAARLGDAVVDRLVEPLLGGVYAPGTPAGCRSGRRPRSCGRSSSPAGVSWRRRSGPVPRVGRPWRPTGPPPVGPPRTGPLWTGLLWAGPLGGGPLGGGPLGGGPLREAHSSGYEEGSAPCLERSPTSSGRAGSRSGPAPSPASCAAVTTGAGSSSSARRSRSRRSSPTPSSSRSRRRRRPVSSGRTHATPRRRSPVWRPPRWRS